MAEALGTYIAEVLKAATYSYEGAEIDYFEDKNGRPDKKVLAIYWEELVLQKIRNGGDTEKLFEHLEGLRGKPVDLTVTSQKRSGDNIETLASHLTYLPDDSQEKRRIDIIIPQTSGSKTQ